VKKIKSYLDEKLFGGKKSDVEVIAKAISKIIKDKAKDAGIDPKEILHYIKV